MQDGEVTRAFGEATSGHWCGTREQDGCWGGGLSQSPRGPKEFRLDFLAKDFFFF